MIKAPKAPKEDPAVAAAREREQKRAEAQRTEETQGLLLSQTVRRLRRFGRLTGAGGTVMSGGSNVPTTTPTVSGSGFNWSGTGKSSGGATAAGTGGMSAFGPAPLVGIPSTGVALW